MTELDFLDVSGQIFDSEQKLFDFVDKEDSLEEVGSNINLIGSVNNYPTRSKFFSAIEGSFERIWQEDEEDLELLAAHSGGRAIPYYVYYDDDFPIFITTANISDEMPNTIENFLSTDGNLGRFWISMEEMDRMRAKVVRRNEDVIIPFFTGHRSAYSDIPADKRGDIKRTMTYWAEDGRETYKEMRKKYGILPTNIRFERPGEFKFGLKQKGIVSHQSGSISNAWELLNGEKDRKKMLKDTINTGGPSTSESNIFEDQNISVAKPWGIQLQSKIDEQAINTFKLRLSEDRWELGLSEYQKVGPSRFSAEIIDNEMYGRTELEGTREAIQVYPIDGNDIDPQFRIYNFAQDHFDSDCQPVRI